MNRPPARGPAPLPSFRRRARGEAVGRRAAQQRRHKPKNAHDSARRSRRFPLLLADKE